ncbi:tol-pal system protein YbgF [Aliidongia dinghuensis]|uniref:Cell division coordinator CpoB n=2 Tax=Aliidongia dinghuensis TaxID=1867774 RepID=A0A8J2YU70_9PROT|nr:tol-pal system protein YbgF [Aliidongia dinghuensis]
MSAAGPASAQDRSVNDRLDRLERDLNQVQRQLYRNEVPATGAAGVAPSGDSGNTALNADIRMDQLEQQMRTLTGQLEEVQFGISELKNRLDKQQQDDEQRFQALEHPDGGGAAKPAQQTAANPPVSAAPGKPGSPGGAGNMDAAPSTGGFLTSPGAGGGGNAGAPAVPGKASVALPNGSATEQYNYAFGLLRSQDYPAAEAAFSQFVTKHPQDELAGNAQYWLGETYFVRNDYNSAAAAFAKGYQLYPKSPKAQDNLLKLGISLGNIGRKQDACFAFAKLERDFPNIAPTNKERATREKQRLGC